MDKMSLIKILNDPCQWEEAIKTGVQLLVNCGIATDELASSIIENTKKLGPYYILMPKVALAHTTPSSYNKSVGLSLVLFRKPIKFSDNERHEVNLLFTLSAIDSDSHMGILSKFANLFSQNGIVEKALEVQTEKELYDLLKEIF